VPFRPDDRSGAPQEKELRVTLQNNDNPLAGIYGNFRRLVAAGRGRLLAPSKNRVDFGDLRRLGPISRTYGYDRGEPVDRYYIKHFLDAHSHRIFGTVLEISENTYTQMFGGDRVTQSDVLHYDDPSPPATVTGDLTDAPHLPSDHYDCVIITQTLMLIFDVPAALNTLHRILKPGGTVLATQAGLTQIADGSWNDTWHWGFTRASANRLFSDAFPGGSVDVRTYGNVLSTIAFLQGLSFDELTTGELDFTDPEYQMLIAVEARKAPAERVE
jgi:SAM-dependent methyltransferase